MRQFYTEHKSLQEYFADRTRWKEVSVVRAIVSVYLTPRQQALVAELIRKRIKHKSIWWWNYSKRTTYEEAMAIFKELHI